ncbi:MULTISPECIES: EamA family transporter [unclassified Cryobacterium]|uniref:EamA family transporter n=2 Tax=Cryobacterium TaxID=69578 RepID=UPI001F541F34|nr:MULTISPECIES: EamA family transporter [unclassified Cryobacterium]MEB0004887.1 EamA family transporter [Cryobacterium sp. RTC2.1]MEB0287548.1 EamA family transporter [Cryobacterium sp. 10S3]WPX13691.1 EamA family transporter [Cryobacterium sp. 10S3]
MPMLTALVGLAGALIYGSADFLGGLAAKRLSSVLVTAVAASSGLLVLLVALPFVGGVWSPDAVLWGALSGVTGAIAISLLYACLAIGPMSILSPLTAVVSAVVPMTAGLVGGERLAPVGYAALGLALVAVVLVGFVPEKGAVRPTTLGVLMAIGSGVMIGAFLILIDLTPDDSGLVPLVLNRAVNAAIMFSIVGVLAVVAARRRRVLAGAGSTGVAVAGFGATDATARATDPAAVPAHTGRRSRSTLTIGLTLAAVCGLVDVAANFLLLIGIRIGDLSVISVLTAMYPAGTILLAAVVLRERIAPVQWVGLGLALAAAAMLALA